MRAMKAAQRLRHIGSHISAGKDVAGVVRNILTGTGSPSGSALSLGSYCLARGMHAWFEHADLSATKQWFKLSGECQNVCLDLQRDQMNLMPRVMCLSRMLVADHEPEISRFLAFSHIYSAKAIANVKSVDYSAFNIVLAVKGEMELLASRCDALRKDPPASHGKKYLPDNEFLAALAVGDPHRMQEVLNDLVSPKMARSRAGLEGGYTQDLISTSAILYAKLARRHGYEIEVESDYIPVPWLPIAPLDNYIAIVDLAR